MEFISITNDIQVARHFEKCGIDDIMVDLEIIGKQERQKGKNTVISAHTIEDVDKIKSCLTRSKCLVRINPIHDGTENEIKNVLCSKPDIIMLPMFKTIEEVQRFIDLVGDRAHKYLLLETPQAMVRIDDILDIPGINAVHIGLNDLSIGMGLDFLYEPLIGGIVEYLASKLRNRNIKFGFGGVSRIEKSQLILSEHFRLGSNMVIVNRDFRKYKDSYDEIVKEVDMEFEIAQIVQYMDSLVNTDYHVLEQNKLVLKKEIKQQIKEMLQK